MCHIMLLCTNEQSQPKHALYRSYVCFGIVRCGQVGTIPNKATQFSFVIFAFKWIIFCTDRYHSH